MACLHRVGRFEDWPGGLAKAPRPRISFSQKMGRFDVGFNVPPTFEPAPALARLEKGGGLVSRGVNPEGRAPNPVNPASIYGGAEWPWVVGPERCGKMTVLSFGLVWYLGLIGFAAGSAWTARRRRRGVSATSDETYEQRRDRDRAAHLAQIRREELAEMRRNARGAARRWRGSQDAHA